MSNKGQQKSKEMVNTTTGERKQITNEDWRVSGKSLRLQGWTREDDDVPETVTEPVVPIDTEPTEPVPTVDFPPKS